MTDADYIYGFHAVHALLRQHPQQAYCLYLQAQLTSKRREVLIALAKQHALPVETVAASVLQAKLPAGVCHQGVAVAARSIPGYDEHDLQQLVDEQLTANEPILLLVLDGVQDPRNLGACLRTANAMGAAAVVIPRDRATAVTPVVRKVACGAAEATPVVTVTNLVRCLQMLQQAGVWVVGLDAEAEENLSQVDCRGALAVVVGAEGQGMRRLTKATCDFLANIPMYGSVASLNVSVATAICLYEVAAQRRFRAPELAR